jgi:hypothetical protein
MTQSVTPVVSNKLPQRIHWRGVLAGLIMGIVVELSLIALGVAIGAGTVSSLSGAAIGSVIWFAISIAVAAFMGGFTAVRASRDIAQTDSRLNGLVTGGLMTLVGSYFLYSTLLSGLGLAGSAVQSVASAAGSGIAAAGSSAAQNGNAQNVIAGISQQDIVDAIANNNQNLTEKQVNAAANVVAGIVRRASNDFSNTGGSNIADFAKSRFANVKAALTGDQFITRLQRQGLNQAQAQEVQTEIGKQVTSVEQRATEAAATAERVARETARTAGWGWLLLAGLTLGLSVLGADRAGRSNRDAVVTDRSSVRS